MTASASRWFLPSGTTRGGGCDVVVDDSLPGWQHTGLRVVTLSPDQSWSVDEPGWEYVVVPLAGAATVACTDAAGEEQSARLTGRASVFAGPTDVAYVPPGSRLTVTGGSDGSRIALCAARARGRGAAARFRHVATDEVPVELRGAGSCSREVRNFGVPATLDADSIIACEVVTPAGNWSSYPPHKHDEERPGVETELEEIYYFEVAGAHGSPGFGYQRVYSSGPDRSIEVFAEVRTGDVVLIPYGYHGPTMAAPGYDLYFLNVLAGPADERSMAFRDDPAHAWVRGSWQGEAADPRVPFGKDGGSAA